MVGLFCFFPSRLLTNLGGGWFIIKIVHWERENGIDATQKSGIRRSFFPIFVFQLAAGEVHHFLLSSLNILVWVFFISFGTGEKGGFRQCFLSLRCDLDFLGLLVRFGLVWIFVFFSGASLIFLFCVYFVCVFTAWQADVGYCIFPGSVLLPFWYTILLAYKVYIVPYQKSPTTWGCCCNVRWSVTFGTNL